MSETSTPRCPFERIQNPDLEAQQIAKTTELTVKLLDTRYPPSKEILRGVHPKSHGCVKATFTINPDISPEFQVGLFAEPGKQFDAIIRFSNAAALVGPDIDEKGKHGSRGMAIKVFDVGGEVLIEDNGVRNQDFLMINQPMFAFANAEDYLRLDKILDEQGDKPDGFFAPLQLQNPALTEEKKQRILAYMKAENIEKDDIQRIANTAKIVNEIQNPTQTKPPVANPLGAQYFSAAPFMFGSDRVMKFSVKPCAEVSPTEIPNPPPENYLRDALMETMNRGEPLYFDFMLQVRHKGEDFGIENDPIENASIENASSEWKETIFPFVKVAKITILAPQPEIDTTENIAHCEKLAFTPWHSLVEHQPIGSINRLRKSVYQASAEHRLK